MDNATAAHAAAGGGAAPPALGIGERQKFHEWVHERDFFEEELVEAISSYREFERGLTERHTDALRNLDRWNAADLKQRITITPVFSSESTINELSRDTPKPGIFRSLWDTTATMAEASGLDAAGVDNAVLSVALRECWPSEHPAEAGLLSWLLEKHGRDAVRDACVAELADIAADVQRGNHMRTERGVFSELLEQRLKQAEEVALCAT